MTMEKIFERFIHSDNVTEKHEVLNLIHKKYSFQFLSKKNLE